VVIKEDKENDIAILKLKGKLNKYKYIPLSKINEANIAPLKSFYMVGYPFGGETFKNLSYIEGKIASINTVDKRKVVFADMFGKPGNSGGPIIDTEKQNVIGIYWGGIKKGDEMINCFTPVEIIWNLIRNKE
jgi:S1-C subfamily serine protease